jgi:hypothetical protein
LFQKERNIALKDLETTESLIEFILERQRSMVMTNMRLDGVPNMFNAIEIRGVRR